MHTHYEREEKMISHVNDVSTVRQMHATIAITCIDMKPKKFVHI